MRIVQGLNFDDVEKTDTADGIDDTPPDTTIKIFSIDFTWYVVVMIFMFTHQDD